jgi:N utilization substance protein B
VGARHKARKRALDILFEADQRGVAIADVMASREKHSEHTANPYTAILVNGVVEHSVDIDQMIQSHSVDWTLERMPAVDRAVLRLGTFELCWAPEQIAPAVVIDEAVELAKELSTDESPSFVNGVLGRIASEA